MDTINGLIPFLINKILNSVADVDSSSHISDKIVKRYAILANFQKWWNLYIPNDLAAKSALLTYKTFIALVPISAFVLLLFRSVDLSPAQIGNNLSMMLPGLSQNTFSDTIQSGEIWIESQNTVLVLTILIAVYSVLSLVLSFDSIVASIWAKDKTVNSLNTQSFMKLLSRGLAAAFCLLTIFGLWETTVNEIGFQGVSLWLLRFIVFGLMSFGLIYYMPLAYPKFFHALISSSIIAFFFLALQFLCSYFIDIMNQYNDSFGDFGTIIIMIVWLRIAWTLVLIGLLCCFPNNWNSLTLN